VNANAILAWGLLDVAKFPNRNENGVSLGGKFAVALGYDQHSKLEEVDDNSLCA
jgi:hypothetical protein